VADTGAIDFEVTGARGAQRMQALAARAFGIGEAQRAARGEPPRRGDLDLEARGHCGAACDADCRRAHEPLPVVLPICAGFSPFSRRLITASMPCCAICDPKSSR